MIDLAGLVRPEHTAVVTMELERGVVGDLATIAALRDAVEAAGLIAAVTDLLDAGRAAGATIVHCIAEWRADRAGTSVNTPLASSLARNPAQILVGSPATELVDGLGPEPSDLVSRRTHGLTPFIGTDLDALLRNCGITTVVAVGVSLNVGVLGLCLNAADLGYRVVVPTDAVIGSPPHFGEEVLRHSVAMVATLTTVEAIAAGLGLSRLRGRGRA